MGQRQDLTPFPLPQKTGQEQASKLQLLVFPSSTAPEHIRFPTRIMAIATRVFASVSRKSSYHDSAWECPESVIQCALQVVKDNNLLPDDEVSMPRLLAKERWQRIHIVFDIFNEGYVPETAHLPGQNNLPVMAVYLSGSGSTDENKAFIAHTLLEQEVNRTIQNFHNWHGYGSLPPFAVDHANGNIPTYPNPRTLIRVETSSV